MTMNRTRTKLAALLPLMALPALIGTSTSAIATPVFYTSEAAYTAAAGTAGITLVLESFETSTEPNFPGGTVTVVGSGSSGISSWVYSVTDGTIGVHWFSSVTFNFDSPINAFGIDIIDLGTGGPTTLTLLTNTGSQVLFGNFTGLSSNVQFGGVIDTATQFVSATFTNTDSGDGVILDRMQTGAGSDEDPGPGPGAVPEPMTLALIGLGLAGLGFSRRKRKQA